MADKLPVLNYEELRATRDYLQDAAKILGRLQQAYLPAEPHGWQYGLEVSLRGATTQTFELDGRPTRALLDLVRHKLRLGDHNWGLRETPPAQLFKNIQALVDRELKAPRFTAGVLEYDSEQADRYAAALWWFDKQFRTLKDGLTDGLTSPILLYPHHFDLSLVWYPRGDERQLAIGWSTGDETIAEPYVYLTAYPNPDRLERIKLPTGAYWQSDGFSGAVLPYSRLRTHKQPETLFKELASLGR